MRRSRYYPSSNRKENTTPRSTFCLSQQFLASEAGRRFHLASRNMENVLVQPALDIDVHRLLKGGIKVFDLDAIREIIGWLGPQRGVAAWDVSAFVADSAAIDTTEATLSEMAEEEEEGDILFEDAPDLEPTTSRPSP